MRMSDDSFSMQKKKLCEMSGFRIYACCNLNPLRQWVGSALVLDVCKPVFGSHVTTCWNGHNKTLQFLKFGAFSEKLTVDVDASWQWWYQQLLMTKLSQTMFYIITVMPTWDVSQCVSSHLAYNLQGNWILEIKKHELLQY